MSLPAVTIFSLLQFTQSVTICRSFYIASKDQMSNKLLDPVRLYVNLYLGWLVCPKLCGLLWTGKTRKLICWNTTLGENWGECCLLLWFMFDYEHVSCQLENQDGLAIQAKWSNLQKSAFLVNCNFSL